MTGFVKLSDVVIIYHYFGFGVKKHHKFTVLIKLWVCLHFKEFSFNFRWLLMRTQKLASPTLNSLVASYFLTSSAWTLHSQLILRKKDLSDQEMPRQPSSCILYVSSRCFSLGQLMPPVLLWAAEACIISHSFLQHQVHSTLRQNPFWSRAQIFIPV